MQRFKKLLGNPIPYPLLLCIVGAISYLYQLTQMGFYWDDWQAVLLYQLQDPKVISAYFAYDRPFSAWTYQLLFPLLPMKAWVWQFLTLLIRGVAVLALVEAFLVIWPARKWLFRWFGLLLFVAPAFSSQPIAVAFNQHFLTMLLFSLSLLFTGLAIKQKRWFWIFLPSALITTAAHLFTMEYFVGLEILRVVYIFCLLSQSEKRRQFTLRKTALVWAPFGVIAAGFVYWRLGIYPTQVQGFLPNDPIILKQFASSPWQSAIELLTRLTKDTIHLLVNNWVDTFSIQEIDFTVKMNLFSLAVGFVAAVVTGIGISRSFSPDSNDNPADKLVPQGIILGFVGIVFGGLPVWLMARQITEGKWSDRFSLAPMIGAILVLVILIDWLIRTRLQKQLILILLLGLSIAFQMRNVNRFKLDWEVQREFYWQLAWRVPALEPGTALISPYIPSGLVSDYSIGYSLNVLYAPIGLSTTVPYWFFTPRDIYESFYDTKQVQEINKTIRNIQFSGSNDKVISFYFKASARCLKVLDEIYLDDPFLDGIDPGFFKLTNPAQISNSDEPITPLAAVFGKEPQHDWCYYFEKADLAHENEQWDLVIKLMDDATTKNLQPAAGSELLPLLDAHLQLGHWDQAVETTAQMIAIPGEITPAICSLLQKYDDIESTIKIPAGMRDVISAYAECK